MADLVRTQIFLYRGDIDKLRELDGAQSRDSGSLLVRAAVYQSIHGGTFESALRAVYEPVGRPKEQENASDSKSVDLVMAS